MIARIFIIVEDDRIHVVDSGYVQRSFMYGWASYPSREEAEKDAYAYAFELILQRQKEGFNIKVLPIITN